MRKSILFLAFLLLVVGLNAQAKFAIRAGISSSELNPEDFVVLDEMQMDQLQVSIENANYGAHFGVALQGMIGENFFVQPEVLFNTSSVDFRVEDFTTQSTSILNESYNQLDIPFMMGWKFGPLRMQGGPVGHVFLNSKSELFDIDGYEQKFSEFTYGYQAGLGLDLWKIMLDIKYEGNFNTFGDHITFGNANYAFSQNPTRIVASLGITF